MEHILEKAEKEKILKRVLNICRINGYSIIIFAGLCCLICIFMGSWSGVIICLAVAASGYMELIGGKKLKDNMPDAAKWFIASQLWLMGLLISYAVYKLLSFEPSHISALLSPELKTLVETQLNLTAEAFTEMIAGIYNLIYISIIAATTIYQGGLCYYYWNSSRKIFESSKTLP